MNTRTTGLLIAFAFALITIGVVLFVYLRHASAPAAQPVAPVVAAEEQIQALDTNSPLQAAGRGRIQGTAKDDPERQVYNFTYDRIDPKPGGVYDVASPAGWIYLEDGHGVHVRAERGQVTAPAPPDSELTGRPAIPTDPEEGNLSGSVVIRLFEHVAPGNEVDPETTEPLRTFRTNVLRFNALTGELSTPDDEEIILEAPDFRYRGTHLRAQYDQVRERFFVRVERDHQLRYVHRQNSHEAQPGGPSATTDPATPATTADPSVATESQATAAPRLELYHCVLVGDLMLQQVGQGRWLKADRLELWARLVDGQLPEGAIAPLAFGEEPAGESLEEKDAASDQGGAAAVTAQEGTADQSLIPLSDTPPDEPNVITLTWTGPLVLSPLDQTPAELEEDQAALRFSGLNGNRVRLTDDGDGAIECALLHYGATTRRATLANTAQVKGGTVMDLVAADSREHGVLRGPVVHADLTTGLLSVDGGGWIQRAGDGRSSRIEWTERADFRFRTLGGRVLASLAEAILAGDVKASDGRGTLTGESVRALFVRGGPGEGGRRPDLLQRLIADGKVLADGGKDDDGEQVGSIAAAHLDVEFDTAAGGGGA